MMEQLYKFYICINIKTVLTFIINYKDEEKVRLTLVVLIDQ